ncbi:hypothetical protein CHS0354_036658 [Potamilus streckersoni]|uniref:Uncharacterized protein n=1 Tax=Potamilus streckersoni TaxID=2493646 RepID=A0AAE0THA9_9BIVA|nr:hypothetical protein CHS0354_036658 [Potamilus streckersoni]
MHTSNFVSSTIIDQNSSLAACFPLFIIQCLYFCWYYFVFAASPELLGGTFDTQVLPKVYLFLNENAAAQTSSMTTNASSLKILLFLLFLYRKSYLHGVFTKRLLMICSWS